MSRAKHFAAAAAILFAGQANAQFSLTPTPGGLGVTGPSGNTVTFGDSGVGYIPAGSWGYGSNSYSPYGSSNYFAPSTSYYPSNSYYAPTSSHYTPRYSTSYYAPSSGYYSPATSGSWGYPTSSYYGPTQRYSTGANVVGGLINRAIRR